MRLPISLGILSLLVCLGCGEASAQIWQQSESHAITLGVGDKERTLGDYTATFVVKGPDGRQHRAEKHVTDGWGYVHFPTDFNVNARDGRHEWVCLVGGRVVARGAFDYDKSRFTLDTETPPTFTSALQKRTRIAKAQADARAIASAVSIFGAHTGRLPKSLAELTQTAQNPQGATAGPFMQTIPLPPSGWSGYFYRTSVNGVFTVHATGDGTVVQVP